MATLKIAVPTVQSTAPQTTLWAKYLAFVDSQKANRTLWFLLSLGFHATFFLPLPLILIGFFNAPVAFLAITMLCFFANFVANMGGAGIRTTFSLFMASILVHIGMIVWTVVV